MVGELEGGALLLLGVFMNSQPLPVSRLLYCIPRTVSWNYFVTFVEVREAQVLSLEKDVCVERKMKGMSLESTLDSWSGKIFYVQEAKRGSTTGEQISAFRYHNKS